MTTNITPIHAERVFEPEPATTARYIEMTIRKRELDAASRKLGEELDRMEAVLLDQWIEVGRQSERLDGVTVYIAARTWATPKDGDRAAVVKALEDLGMRDMVTYNTQTLSAWFKERATAEQEVPATLAEVVSLETKHSLNVRKGK